MTLWYTARGAGLATLVALTVATTLGAVGSRKSADIGRRVVVQYLHRTAALLGIGLLAVHVGTILLDAQAGVGVVGALVPFAASYRPGAVALGSITAYTVVAVAAFGLARGRLAGSVRGARTWRGVHLLSYAAWATALWHGVTAGTDTELTWVRLLYVGCLLAVPLALVTRLASGTVLRPMAPVEGGAR